MLSLPLQNDVDTYLHARYHADPLFEGSQVAYPSKSHYREEQDRLALDSGVLRGSGKRWRCVVLERAISEYLRSRIP